MVRVPYRVVLLSYMQCHGRSSPSSPHALNTHKEGVQNFRPLIRESRPKSGRDLPVCASFAQLREEGDGKLYLTKQIN